MPSIRSLAAENAAWDDQFRASIRMLMAVGNLTREQLAVKLGMTVPTLRKKLEDPGRVTKHEERMIYRLCAYYGVTYKSEFNDNGGRTQ